MAAALAATGAAFAVLIGSAGVTAFLTPFALSSMLSLVALLRAARVNPPGL